MCTTCLRKLITVPTNTFVTTNAIGSSGSASSTTSAENPRDFRNAASFAAEKMREPPPGTGNGLRRVALAERNDREDDRDERERSRDLPDHLDTGGGGHVAFLRARHQDVDIDDAKRQ